MLKTHLNGICRYSPLYVLNWDGSDYAISRVLHQWADNSKHKVIAHVGRSVKGAERTYFMSEKEILAIVYCLSKFRSYMTGQHFEILPDSEALLFLLKCKLTNVRM